MLKVIMTGKNAELYTPYNPDFVKAIKNIGGARWESSKKCWKIPAEAVESAREIMTTVYGHHDQETAETVSVRIQTTANLWSTRSDVTFLGKVLSCAFGRDSGARPGDDVSYIKGRPTSGGSVKNWASVVKEGSVITLSNVSKKLYDQYVDGDNKESGIEIVSATSNAVDKTVLMEEREKLLNRIAEIDQILNAENSKN